MVQGSGMGLLRGIDGCEYVACRADGEKLQSALVKTDLVQFISGRGKVKSGRSQCIFHINKEKSLIFLIFLRFTDDV